MNVTVLVAKSLAPAVEGRSKLDLGVPTGADLGDLLQTLLELYPRLRMHLATERSPARQQLWLAIGEPAHPGAPALREGQRVWLCGTPAAPRPSPAPA